MTPKDHPPSTWGDESLSFLKELLGREVDVEKKGLEPKTATRPSFMTALASSVWARLPESVCRYLGYDAYQCRAASQVRFFVN